MDLLHTVILTPFIFIFEFRVRFIMLREDRIPSCLIPSKFLRTMLQYFHVIL